YASGLDSNIGRLSSLSDNSGTLESYSYLGLGTVVTRAHPQPNVDLTDIGTPGDGGGFFADRNPQVLQTGIDPQQVLVGHFVDPNELDLVTINAGSNDVTLFRNSGSGQSIGSGGERPIAAVQGDFNHDGIEDLIIAKNGDGRETLLLGRPDGLAFS